MNLRSVSLRSLLLLPAALFALSACTDEKIVEVPVDRPPFNPPADEVNGFLGLYDVATNQPTCGNCHTSTNAQWKTSAHATAYESIANIPNAADNCGSCHAVSERGNVVGLTSTGGWSTVQDDAYKNVQCESCHGPGLDHVTSPETSSTWPLARIDITPETEAASCGNCHSGAAHHPFSEQWKLSGHANEELAAEEGGNASCNGCHEGRAALKRFNGGESSNYVELTGTKMISLTCSVCHDPHGSENPAQLRRPLSGLIADENMCISCHLRPGRSQPTASFTASTETKLVRGSHAPQGSVFSGENAGWLPPGFTFEGDRVFSTHASETANPTLCAGCHVQQFVVEGEAGEPEFTSVGHTFQAAPCVDANGVTTGESDCEYTNAARNWTACTTSGCHSGGEDVAVTLFLNQRNNVRLLVEELWADDGVIAPDPVNEPIISPATDGGLLPWVMANVPQDPTCKKNGVPVAPFDGSDNCLSVAEGALWNAMLLAEELYAQQDGSKGTHNPFFYEALLASTIEAVRAAYPGAPAIRTSTQSIITKALSRPGIKYTRTSAVRQTAAR
jgi:predicted CXXCH cytochrome family protein